ncbi:MAG: right-handed parallel beta-helix repeat-containing protein [Acidobacteriota bacterium]
MIRLATALVFVLCAPPVSGQSLIRVPIDVADLESAITQIADGGIIELATGAYQAPGGGFRIQFPGKRFTVRAATGATVVLDGGDTTQIFAIEDDPGGAPFRFENLTFRNGSSTVDAGAGGVNVLGAPVVFARCSFLTNHGGNLNTAGGVRIASDATVTFLDSTWENNTAIQKGAALGVYDASATVIRGRFVDNRTDVSGHGVRAAAAGIFVLDGSLVVERSRFENNRAASVGGAINGLGVFTDPPTSEPATRIVVRDSTFVGNRVAEHPCCPSGLQAVGGAIHVEDSTLLLVERSRFESNEATWGGAISTFRAAVEIDQSTFRGNRARTDDTIVGVGGTFAVNSADRDETNRPSGRLTVRRSLIQGRFGATEIAATQGGCVFANGDQNRLFGNGVPQNTNLEAVRAFVTIEQSVLQDCDVGQGTTADGIFGGAIAGLLADFTINDSLIFDSDALGANAVGGGIALLTYSRATLTDTRLAANVAETRGGAIHAIGSELIVDRGAFVGNEISPGINEALNASTGAAIHTQPFLGADNSGLDRAAQGTVANTLFVDQVGLPLWEIDLDSGPINAMRYQGNRFFERTFPDRVFNNLLTGSVSATDLDDLVVVRTGAPSTDKSDGGNQRLASRPREGVLVAAPSRIRTDPPPGEPAPSPAWLGWLWSGTAATIDGAALGSRVGSRPETVAGERVLTVDGEPSATATFTGEGTASGGCVATDTRMCLGSGRFQVEVSWESTTGEQGAGRVVAGVQAEDSGLIYFFDPNNWEFLIKVLDGCGLNNHYWVFAAGTTNLGYRLTITDTVTASTAVYTNPPGSPAPAITDTTALPVCP